jgi:PAS domain S-box-containing protein
VRRLYRSVPVGKSKDVILVGVSEREALAPVRASLARNLVIGAGMLLLVGALGLILQRRIARPARRLGLAINALATDPEAPDAPVEGPNELAAVAATFNATADARRKADGLSRAILQHASDLLLVLDSSFSLAFVGAVAEREMGLSVGDSAGTLLGRLHPDDRERCLNAVREWAGSAQEDLELEARVHDAHGSVRWMDVRAQDLREDRSVAGIVLTCRDVTDRKAFEEHLAHQARHDSLTGLANRAAVLDRLAADLADPASGPVCVFFIDLDRFKLVNDSHGHAVGDKVLIALAH